MQVRFLTIATVIAWLAAVVPAYALTAEDVMKRMTPAERTAYFFGAVEMAIYLEELPTKSSTSRSRCIVAWYFEPDAKGPAEVRTLFEANLTRPASGLVNVAINRACGKQTGN